MSNSIILFHGPRGREEAVSWAESNGRLIAPVDGGKLKVDTSRHLIGLLDTIPIGDRVGTLVIGPMDDLASSNASDALLKALEDCDTRYVHPALWAEDIGMVPNTIRSRTVDRWCPAHPGVCPEAPYVPTAKTLCDAALRGRIASIIETLGESEGSETEILSAAALVLLQEEEWDLEDRLRLWASIRGALIGSPSRRSALSAFLVG